MARDRLAGDIGKWDLLLSQKPFLRGYSSDDINDMASGDSWIHQMWSGDFLYFLLNQAETLGHSKTSGSIIPAPGTPAPAEPEASAAPPPWAKAMKDRQTLAHSASIAAHTLKSGDGGGAGATIDTSEKE